MQGELATQSATVMVKRPVQSEAARAPESSDAKPPGPTKTQAAPDPTSEPGPGTAKSTTTSAEPVAAPQSSGQSPAGEGTPAANEPTLSDPAGPARGSTAANETPPSTGVRTQSTVPAVTPTRVPVRGSLKIIDVPPAPRPYAFAVKILGNAHTNSRTLWKQTWAFVRAGNGTAEFNFRQPGKWVQPRGAAQPQWQATGQWKPDIGYSADKGTMNVISDWLFERGIRPEW